MVGRPERMIQMDDESKSQRVIDPIYLPFTEAQLGECFAAVSGDASDRSDPERHLSWYRTSAENRGRLTADHVPGTPATSPHEERLRQQMEKDERFWVASTLMTLFRKPNRIENLVKALAIALGELPSFGDFGSWKEALGDGDELKLYFEVNLPSPVGYNALDPSHIDAHLDQRMLAVPHLLKSARKAGRRGRVEGTTKVDAMIVAPGTGFAVLFEAKVMADMSPGTSYDVTRNQMLRSIDVMLEKNSKLKEPLQHREPCKTCFVLLTPEIFKANKEYRFYGHLYHQYRDPELGFLQRHLAGRSDRSAEDLAAVPDRLGWLTWEDCHRIEGDACPWLEHPNHTY
jgi:hypothetical protein